MKFGTTSLVKTKEFRNSLCSNNQRCAVNYSFYGGKMVESYDPHRVQRNQDILVSKPRPLTTILTIVVYAKATRKNLHQLFTLILHRLPEWSEADVGDATTSLCRRCSAGCWPAASLRHSTSRRRQTRCDSDATLAGWRRPSRRCSDRPCEKKVDCTKWKYEQKEV